MWPAGGAKGSLTRGRWGPGKGLGCWAVRVRGDQGVHNPGSGQGEGHMEEAPQHWGLSIPERPRKASLGRGTAGANVQGGWGTLELGR